MSKFKKLSNAVDPAKISPEPRHVGSQMIHSAEDSACYEDREFWKDGDRSYESSVHCLDASLSKTSVKDGDSSRSVCSRRHEEMEEPASVLECAKPVLPAINSTNVAMPLAERNSEHLLESAREILAFQASGASSSSNTVTAEPLSSINSALPKMKTAVSFDIPATGEKTVCPSARVPWRLRNRGKVAPELTLEDVKERMRAAEERKLKELERIRESARSRVGMGRPHPAEVSAQVTKEKMAAKQAAAERKRNEEIEKRKEAGNRASRSRNRIAAARAFAKSQLESSIGQKMEEAKQRKVKKQEKIDKQKKLRDNYAQKVKDRVSISKIITVNIIFFKTCM